MTMTDTERTKTYNRIKLRLGIIDMLADLALIAILAFSGISVYLVQWIRSAGIINPYHEFIIFLMLAGTAGGILGLPLDFYSGFLLEHRYGLSNQTLLKWAAEKLKSLALGACFGLPLSLLFLFLLRTAGSAWWLYFAGAVFALSVLLARLAPVFIFPLFYKFTKLEPGEVDARIRRLLEGNGISFRGIYSFNLSKNTKKANAGFTGIGRSRRIVLSDTLLENFTPGEIEVIFAHELGHYSRRHILKNIVTGGVLIFTAFFLCDAAYSFTRTLAGFPEPHDTAAIPILFFYLTLLGLAVMPLTNAISRHYEREADRFALAITGGADDFISGMEKLAALNLADREPSRAVEFMFYSHPSINRRIRFARELTDSRE